MRAVNLLPGDIRGTRKAPPIPVLVGVVLGVLVTLALSAAFLSASGKVADKRHTLEDKQAELAALPPVKAAPDSSATDALNAEQAARVTALTGALQRRVSWDRVLRELSMVLPNDVWLTNLSAKAPQSAASAAAAPTPTAGSTPTGLVLGGYTYSQEAVARLLTRLQVVPDLTNVQLQTSAITPLGKQSVVAFTILADIKPGATA
jgi:Tfp pilus assembly protein PilN